MKNLIKNLNSIIGSIIFPLLILVVFLFQSCDTDIPPTDTDPPTFALKISGEGFNRTFTQDDDFSSFKLNLTEDALYDFMFSVGDSGGLKSAQMQFPGDYLEIETDLPVSWTSRYNNSLSTTVSWRGDVNNPVTGAILNGKFRISGDNVAFGILFNMRDFGGESGSSNQLFKDLQIDVGHHPTGIVY